VAVSLPVHASCLNQVEIYFSILQRKALTPNDFADLDAVAHRLLSFDRRFSQRAEPFHWHFTREALDRLLTKLGAPEPPLAKSPLRRRAA
jgi:hypothetical protein